MNRLLLTFLLAFTGIAATAQSFPLLDSLNKELANARTDEARIKWLDELSHLYMAINTAVADSLAKKQEEIAELSRDRRLMVQSIMSSVRRLMNNYSGKQDMLEKSNAAIQKGIAIAKESALDKELALLYTMQSRYYRFNGQSDKALNFSNMALGIANTTGDDSIKVLCLGSLANAYNSKDEKLLAFRYYLDAMNLAEKDKRYELLRRVYDDIADFYQSIESYEKAKDYRFRILQLNLANNKPYDRFQTYRSIGALYRAAKETDRAILYFEKMQQLADTLRFSLGKITSYFEITNLYLGDDANLKKGFDYLRNHPEITDFLVKNGMQANLDLGYGGIFTQLGKFDSAAFYLQRAAPFYEKNASVFTRLNYYSNMMNFHQKKGNVAAALDFGKKVLAIGGQTSNLEILKYITKELDSLSQKSGDYKAAFAYNSQYIKYKDSLEKLGKAKDLLALEIDNENKRKERLRIEEENETRRRHNVQYLGITAGIVTVFIMLIMLGFFRVSVRTIKALGFFAFIFLFEFIILLADHQIHHWTHGEPWKILAIKIVLIAILLPLHHYLEHKVIHYLTSHKLLAGVGKSLFHQSPQSNLPEPHVSGSLSKPPGAR
jgi:hypothetical protein